MSEEEKKVVENINVQRDTQVETPVSKSDSIKVLKKGGKIIEISDEDKEKLSVLNHAQKRAENLRKGRERLAELRKLKQSGESPVVEKSKQINREQITVDPDQIVAKIQEKIFADFDERIQRNSRAAYEAIKEEKKKKKEEAKIASAPVAVAKPVVEIRKSPAELLIMQLTGRRK